MARLGEIQLKSGIKDIDQVMNYLYQLEEQLRYALNNLDSENIRDGAISAEQLSGAVRALALSFSDGEAARKTEDSPDFRLHIGTEKPVEKDVLWIRPGTETNEGQLCQIYWIRKEEEA